MTPTTFPVAEVFGPTVQGEGPDAGRPCYFVRFGGCDYSCSWCDSLHAVLPASVRQLPRRSAQDVHDELRRIGCGSGDTVVLSGGNPVLHELWPLVEALKADGVRVSVETQGSRFRPWVLFADLVVVSPKPPSSGMTTDWNALETFLNHLRLDAPTHEHALKVVVGDLADYEFAATVHDRFPTVPFYVSVLNPAGSDGEAFDLSTVLESYRWLCETVAHDPRMADARAMPQLHTLAWGSEQGR